MAGSENLRPIKRLASNTVLLWMERRGCVLLCECLSTYVPLGIASNHGVIQGNLHWVHGDLVLGGIADETLGVREGDIRRGGAVTLREKKGKRSIKLVMETSFWKGGKHTCSLGTTSTRSCILLMDLRWVFMGEKWGGRGQRCCEMVCQAAHIRPTLKRMGMEAQTPSIQEITSYQMPTHE